MSNKIEQKIVSYKVKSTDLAAPEVEPAQQGMHEAIKRPEMLVGATYKIKPPTAENALYVTINDLVMDGKRHPYEIFFNSKEMDHFQWATALTRVVSAVFRKGGDVTFLADELKQIFDPRGGHRRKGGVYVPSLVAEIGYVIETHLKATGHIVEEVDTHMQAFIEKKREEVGVEGSQYPEHATVCAKCGAKAVVKLDGCWCCVECGDSKCT